MITEEHTGFDFHQRVDPVVVADVTEDGTLSSLDASLVARKAALLDEPQIPDLPESAAANSDGSADVLSDATTAGTSTASGHASKIAAWLSQRSSRAAMTPATAGGPSSTASDVITDWLTGECRPR